MILPPTREMDPEKILAMVDGVLLSGGVDVDPQTYGEQPIPKMGAMDPDRDRFELKLVQKAIEKKKPLLAICRGIQILNVASGGTLYQDIYTQIPTSIKHVWHSVGSYDAPPRHPVHVVRIKRDSRIFKIFQEECLRVNSFHHQAIKKIGEHFAATAWAEDGVVEAIEHHGGEFIVGVQWHPERMIDGGMLRIFKAFVDSARLT